MTVRRLRRLGSIASAAAKARRDWHDFADHVAADRAVAPLPQSHAPQPASGADTGGRQIDAAQLLGIIEAIRKSGVWLSANAREFLNSLECRADCLSERTLSERQHQWLVDLASQAAAEKV